MDRRRRILLAVTLLVFSLAALALFPRGILRPMSSAREKLVDSEGGDGAGGGDAAARFLAAFQPGKSTGFDWLRTKDIFVFGDSFSSSASTSDSVGETHLKWCDYLHKTYLPEGRYTNYASDGATIDSNLVPPRLPSSGTLDDQIAAFRRAKVEFAGDTSLFVVVLGINDVREMARREFQPPILTSTATALPAALLTRLSALHALGARHFLTFTLAQLDHAPKYQPGGIGHNISDLVAEGVRLFNGALPGAIEEWESTVQVDVKEGTEGIEGEGRPRVTGRPHVMVYPWDALFAFMLSHAPAFGLTDTRHYKVSVDGGEREQGRMGLAYLDPSHPTWPVSQALARSVNAFLTRQSRSWSEAQRTWADINVY